MSILDLFKSSKDTADERCIPVGPGLKQCDGQGNVQGQDPQKRLAEHNTCNRNADGGNAHEDQYGQILFYKLSVHGLLLKCLGKMHHGIFP